MNVRLSINLKGTAKSAFQIFAVLVCCILMIIFPKGTSDGAGKGLKYCLELLIPSLFPFMVLSSYMVRSGISAKLSKIFSPAAKLLFRLPGSAAPTVIMSFIGGFPVGAKGIAGLYETKLISLNQAKRMSLFCVGAGPAFLITAVGTVLLNNVNLGIILLISQILSGFILGIISRFFYTEKEIIKTDVQKSNAGRSNPFVEACADGSNGIISLSALVVLFQAFIGIIEQSGLSQAVCKILSILGVGRYSEIILPSILEVTGACSLISQGAFHICILSAVIAFGGLCVHLQIWGILSEIQPNKLLFIFFRLLNAVLSGFFTYLITLFYNPAGEVFNSFSEKPSANMATHFSGGLAVLILSMLFMLSISITKNKLYNKNHG